MDLSSKQLADLISGMRNAYAHGENAMAYAREALRTHGVAGRNQRLATLIAYDLQADTYVEGARANPEEKQRWCRQLADLIAPVLPKGGSLLEVGVGEATTLAGVLTEFWGGEPLASTSVGPVSRWPMIGCVSNHRQLNYLLATC